MSIADSGDTMVLINGDNFKKFEFRGDKLRRLWIAKGTDAGSSFGEFSRSLKSQPLSTSSLFQPGEQDRKDYQGQ